MKRDAAEKSMETDVRLRKPVSLIGLVFCMKESTTPENSVPGGFIPDKYLGKSSRL
jgi:hypothetical protein